MREAQEKWFKICMERGKLAEAKRLDEKWNFTGKYPNARRAGSGKQVEKPKKEVSKKEKK